MDINVTVTSTMDLPFKIILTSTVCMVLALASLNTRILPEKIAGVLFVIPMLVALGALMYKIWIL